MGNHDVGRAMSAAAKGFWAGNGEAPVTKDKALAVLDAAAEDFIGADAEFDDELRGDTPLSRLIAIAFEATPDLLASRDGELDDDGEGWYEGSQRQFSERYKFC